MDRLRSGWNRCRPPSYTPVQHGTYLISLSLSLLDIYFPFSLSLFPTRAKLSAYSFNAPPYFAEASFQGDTHRRKNEKKREEITSAKWWEIHFFDLNWSDLVMSSLRSTTGVANLIECNICTVSDRRRQKREDPARPAMSHIPPIKVFFLFSSQKKPENGFRFFHYIGNIWSIGSTTVAWCNDWFPDSVLMRFMIIFQPRKKNDIQLLLCSDDYMHHRQQPVSLFVYVECPDFLFYIIITPLQSQ